MLYESSHVRVSTNDGIGTLWLSPPRGRIGSVVLQQMLAAVSAASAEPGVEILVLRAGTPVGFGRGLSEACEALPLLGQRVTAAIAGLPIATVAFIEGACLGPGLELALACDYRLAVAGPDSWVSLGDLPPGWGGRTRLRLMGVSRFDRLTAREAVRAGVFDHACCERRGKIDLRTHLDRLQFHPTKRAVSWRSWFVDAEVGFAAERRAFRSALREGFGVSEVPVIRTLECVGLVGDSPAVRFLASECSMRGASVVWVEGTPSGLFTEALLRGRMTPLEVEQATKRIHFTSDADALTACDWVVLSDANSDLAGMLERDLHPRAILCVSPAHLDRVMLLASRPQRVVGLRIQNGSAVCFETDPDTTAIVAGWLGTLGVSVSWGELIPSPAFA